MHLTVISEVLLVIDFFVTGFTYSRVPNKRTGRLLENLKKSHLYALIWDYTIINFQQKVPPIRLFPPIFSRLCQIKSMLAIFFMNFSLTVL